MLGAMRRLLNTWQFVVQLRAGLGWCMSRHVPDSFKQMLYLPSLGWWWGHQAISNKDVWLKHFLTWEQLTNIWWEVPGHHGGCRDGEMKPPSVKGRQTPNSGAQWHTGHGGESKSQQHRGWSYQMLLLLLEVYAMLEAPGSWGHCLGRT